MIRPTIIVAAAILVSACAQVPRKPIDVSLMPDDCANRHAIIAWLENTARHTQTRDYPNERYVSDLKTRIWSLRYRCQPV